MELRWGQRTQVMGVINLTPDSFSDGGQFNRPELALAQAKRLVAQGVEILDLGAQSTRPGAEDVGSAAELERLLPALRLIRAAIDQGELSCPPRPDQQTGAAPVISVDTYRAAVAKAALAAGADWINDVTGGRREPEILGLVAEAGCPYVLMHSRGDSQSMDGLTDYGAAGLVPTVLAELRQASDRALAAGLRREQLIWDPGLGFAKTTEQNLELLRGLPLLRAEGIPLLVGPSRKRFIGAVLDEPRPKARLWGTAAVVAQCVSVGVDVVRVHDGGPIVQVARMADALWR
ncbi:MAG: dihydropteroate synthase [Vulcanococcus sp.]|jgi:dihydropteroate synthase|uniref:dihydropteroate synthase n=1 Tax=Vulcanococcus sp. TaxID=2856995 RepID=UPI0025D61B47|nr:dihydropteroate synthase [Vulcanococcus sp.]MBW0166873.1 dihydropteroate synthase [Vulcanococcus sp.]MBW0173155.1 dihydropteroate synthase [Vulcanococcus sp.]MBW0181344.1 dihydropteroate synthase [Vulcanococcus sp.]